MAQLLAAVHCGVPATTAVHLRAPHALNKLISLVRHNNMEAMAQLRAAVHCGVPATRRSTPESTRLRAAVPQKTIPTTKVQAEVRAQTTIKAT